MLSYSYLRINADASTWYNDWERINAAVSAFVHFATNLQISYFFMVFEGELPAFGIKIKILLASQNSNTNYIGTFMWRWRSREEELSTQWIRIGKEAHYLNSYNNRRISKKLNTKENFQQLILCTISSSFLREEQLIKTRSNEPNSLCLE